MTDPDTASDEDVLARTVYGEARGEGAVGMKAVACVVLNRAAVGTDHPHFGDGTVRGACLAHQQFSCWNADDPNRELIQTVSTADPVFAAATQIAADAVDGTLADVTNGATYYYATGTPEPAWACGKTPCATIGRHIFFSGIE